MVKKRVPAKKSKKPAPKAKSGKAPKAAKPRKARSGEQLELIKGVRFADLDRLCREIGDNRDEVNILKEEGTGLELRALKTLRLHGVTGYKNAGVYISIVPGDEKLSVKRDRAGKASDGGGAVEQPAGGDETPEGQDPEAIADRLTEGSGEGDEGDLE